jgi:F-type H+-transporting ATPase subunit gamma
MAIMKEIREKESRIRSTKKITGTLEKVAARKMASAVQWMRATEPYTTSILKVIQHVTAANPEYKHPFLRARGSLHSIGIIVITSDRGLCGGLNSNLYKHIFTTIKGFNHPTDIKLGIIGTKGLTYFKRHKFTILGAVEQISLNPTLESIVGVAKVLIDAYLSGAIDSLYLAGNHFINTMVQQPYLRAILPFSRSLEQSTKLTWDYIYEPDEAPTLLNVLLMRYLESQIYYGVIENITCFQAAQMFAMKKANDNANTIINELKIAYNKARQAAITREICEIVAGADAI